MLVVPSRAAVTHLPGWKPVEVQGCKGAQFCAILCSWCLLSTAALYLRAVCMCVFLVHYRQALEMPLQKGGFVHRHWFTHASRTQIQQGCIFMYRIEGQTGINCSENSRTRGSGSSKWKSRMWASYCELS